MTEHECFSDWSATRRFVFLPASKDQRIRMFFRRDHYSYTWMVGHRNAYRMCWTILFVCWLHTEDHPIHAELTGKSPFK